MMKFAQSLLIFCFSIIFFSCSKVPTEMPPATSNGAGTMGYYLNGDLQYSIDDSDCKRCTKPTAGLEIELNHCNTYYLRITGFVFPDKELAFSLYISSLDTGRVPLYQHESCNRSFADYADYNDGGVFYETNLDYGGYLQITHLDSSLDFVSGTFEIEVEKDDQGEVFEITEGRFDIPLTVW